MYKYNIYIGMFDKDAKQQKIPSQDFFNLVRKVMRFFKIDNYTIYKCKGHYKHEDGKTVCEPSLNIEIIEPENWSNHLYVSNLKRTLCDSLNQESVLITKQEIQVL